MSERAGVVLVLTRFPWLLCGFLGVIGLRLLDQCRSPLSRILCKYVDVLGGRFQVLVFAKE